MEKSLQQWMNEFVETRTKEGASRDTIFAIKGCFRKFLEVKSDISDNSISDFVEHATTLQKSSRKVYGRFLRQLQKFVNGEPRRVIPKIINFELLELALEDSFVDENKVLMVKYSNVPALISWANILKNHSNIDFDYHATVKARRKHNDIISGNNGDILRSRKKGGLKSAALSRIRKLHD